MSNIVECPRCSHANDRVDRFCSNCGKALTEAPQPNAGGAVVDGVWERAADEFVRRVEPEDARHMLGQRLVRVPEGSLGVILVNGVVDRIVGPGERTALSLFERVTDFFRGGIPKTAFFLVDLRPVAVPFVVRGRPNTDGRATSTQVLVTFRVPRGDRAALGLFLDTIVGPRTALAARDLHDLVRSDVVRVTEGVLERHASAGEVLATDAVENDLRAGLAALLELRHGLLVDVGIAPLTAIQTLSFHLGTAEAPAHRACHACRRELPVHVRFCDGCGARQPTLAETAVAPDATTPLFTADGEPVELDLVVRVTGQHQDFAPHRLVPALVAAASRQLAAASFADLMSEGGFNTLETALRAAVGAPLTAFGLSLVELAVVDARSRHGQWMLAAQSELARTREAVAASRNWLEAQSEELDLESLTLGQALRAQKLRRQHDLDTAFERDAAALADRRRRQGLETEAAAIEIEATRRSEQLRRERDALLRETMRLETAERRVDDHSAAEHQRALEKAQAEHGLALEAARHAQALAQQVAARRSSIDLDAYAEARQLEKLRAMAELDRSIAADEHRETLEKRRQLEGMSPEAMIALQAAELAATGHGDAWAEALAARARAEADAQHRAELARVQTAAIEAMGRVAASRAEAAPVVAAAQGPVVTVGATAASKPCRACGATLRAEATFCGACGADQR